MRRPSAPPTLRALALILAVTAVLGACGGSSRGTTDAAVDGAAPSTAAHAGWATPQVLPVTPAAIDYHAKDPTFEALPGARAIYGTYSGGAYQIEVPDAWNGSVVYYAHGFRGSSAELSVDAPPLRAYLIAQGYAWAASSYSENGYNPGAGARDTYALRTIFEERVGKPRRSYLVGASMGGNVVTVSLELYPTAYDGALSGCGALVGQEIVSYFLSWGALAGYLSGSDLTSETSDPRALGRTVRQQVLPALGAGPDKLTAKGKAFESAIEELTGGPRPYFHEGFAANYLFNFGVLLNAVAAPGAANGAAENADTLYRIADGLGISTDELNRGIARVRADPRYLDGTRYPEFAPLSGKLQRPLLTLHGTGDLYVPISLERDYRRIVDAAGAGDLLVQRAVRRAGHCAFTDGELRRAFDDLVAWVERGVKPAGDDLLGDLRDVGRAFTQPLGDDDPGGLTP